MGPLNCLAIHHGAENGVGQGADFWYPSMRRPAPPRSQRITHKARQRIIIPPSATTVWPVT